MGIEIVLPRSRLVYRTDSIGLFAWDFGILVLQNYPNEKLSIITDILIFKHTL